MGGPGIPGRAVLPFYAYEPQSFLWQPYHNHKAAWTGLAQPPAHAPAGCVYLPAARSNGRKLPRFPPTLAYLHKTGSIECQSQIDPAFPDFRLGAGQIFTTHHRDQGDIAQQGTADANKQPYIQHCLLHLLLGLPHSIPQGWRVLRGLWSCNNYLLR